MLSVPHPPQMCSIFIRHLRHSLAVSLLSSPFLSSLICLCLTFVRSAEGSTASQLMVRAHSLQREKDQWWTHAATKQTATMAKIKIAQPSILNFFFEVEGLFTNMATSSRRGTVECYDCHQQVADLRSHRAVCIDRSRPKERKERKTKKRPAAATDATTVFMLLDVSGSMQGTKLKAVKEATTACFSDMDASDRFAICTFDQGAFFKLKPRPVEQLRRQDELPGILDRIFAKGQTALYDAIMLTLEQLHEKDARNRIIVLTDGEDNASKHTLDDVLALLAKHPAIGLSIIHVDGSGKTSPAYERLVGEGRGSYQVVQQEDEETIIKITLQVFKRVYAKE